MSTLYISNDIANILSYYTYSKANTNSFPKMTVRIYTCNRIVSAVCKKIKAGEIAICPKQINSICIDEPTDGGIVIPALEVIEPSLFGISHFIPKLSSPWQINKTEVIFGVQG